MLAAINPVPVEIAQSWLEILAVWTAVGAAIVTAITAVFIWLQIRQTKRSVEATERTLELAMAEQELNRRLIIDAQKARIDAELPKLLVWVQTQSRGVIDPRYPAGAYDPMTDQSSSLRDIPLDRVWSLLEEGESPLAVSLAVTISNDGPRRARVSLGIRGDPEHGSYVKETVVGIGEVEHVRLIRSHTVADWAALASHDYSPLGDVGDNGWNWDVLTVTYIHQGTEGAIERWVVRQGGSPLVPVPGEPDKWRLGTIKWDPTNEGGHVNAGVDLPSREYYSSMADQRRLG